LPKSEESSRSKEELNKTDEILSHVRSIDAQMGWVIRSEETELRKLLLKYFAQRKRAAKVYLSIDSKRTSGNIADYLGILVQNVSKEISDLEGRGLIELKKWGIYKKSKIDTILRLSAELKKDPDLAKIK
jgi:hypothetical protein